MVAVAKKGAGELSDAKDGGIGSLRSAEGVSPLSVMISRVIADRPRLLRALVIGDVLAERVSSAGAHRSSTARRR